MVKYAKKLTVEEENKIGKSMVTDAKIHFKNVVNVVAAIKGMTATRATAYLNNVLGHTEAIPFTSHKGGRGRHAQSKALGTPGSLVGWPTNSVKAVLDLLKNASANAVAKGLDADKLVVDHAFANMARKTGRRTYRAHGRIGAYKRTPANVELYLKQKDEAVAKPKDEKAAPRLFKRKLAARFRVKEATA